MLHGFHQRKGVDKNLRCNCRFRRRCGVFTHRDCSICEKSRLPYWILALVRLTCKGSALKYLATAALALSSANMGYDSWAAFGKVMVRYIYSQTGLGVENGADLLSWTSSFALSLHRPLPQWDHVNQAAWCGNTVLHCHDAGGADAQGENWQQSWAFCKPGIFILKTFSHLPIPLLSFGVPP